MSVFSYPVMILSVNLIKLDYCEDVVRGAFLETADGLPLQVIVGQATNNYESTRIITIIPEKHPTFQLFGFF